MTKREFERLIRECSGRGRKGMVDKAKVAALPDTTKHEATCFLVRHRLPILIEFVLPEDDRWLNCCAYFQVTTGKRSGYTFRHTAEQRII